MKPEDIDVVSKHKDVVFRVFPFAVAQFVIDAFWFLCPASRHVVGVSSFKFKVTKLICRVFFGHDLCRDTILTRRRALYPNDSDLRSEHSIVDLDGDGKISREEYIEHVGSERGFDSLDRDGDGKLAVAEFLNSSTHTSSTRSEKNKKKKNKKILRGSLPPPTYTNLLRDATSIESPETKMHANETRQGREVFQTHRTTALLQRHLGLPNQNLQGGIAHAVTMKRTVPSSRCRVGGVATHRVDDFREDLSNHDVRGEFRDTLVMVNKQRRDAHAESLRDEAQDREALRAVLNTTDRIFLRRFAMEASRKDMGSRERLDHMTKRALSSSVRSEGDAAGKKKVAW